jgi:hypothetical protein
MDRETAAAVATNFFEAPPASLALDALWKMIWISGQHEHEIARTKPEKSLAKESQPFHRHNLEYSEELVAGKSGRIVGVNETKSGSKRGETRRSPLEGGS